MISGDKRVPTLKDTYSLPRPLPQWPSSPQAAAAGGQKGGFATGIINIGELEIAMVKKFEGICSIFPPGIWTNSGMSFFKPVSVPDGFHIFGHFSQPLDQKQLSTGYLLVAREAASRKTSNDPPLSFPVTFGYCWSTSSCYLWKPCPPCGYQAMGYVVTTSADRPPRDTVVCVRDDLVLPLEIEDYEPFDFASGKVSVMSSVIGANIGHIFANDKVLTVRCLRNLNHTNVFEAMPNLEQVEALIKHYGPTVYFHPDEVYLPSSVPWFINKGYSLDSQTGGDFCFDDDVMRGANLEDAKLYAYVKPALGGIFTDIDMWIFFPAQGLERFTALMLFNAELRKIDQHVGHWEHFTLRINNFDGQLWRVYFSGHNGSGEWVDVGNLEYTQGTNKPIVYSSKSCHKTFPNAGKHIQGYTKLGIGIGMELDAEKSDRFIDSSKKYQIIAAGYLGGVVAEPEWLKNMQECRPERVFYSGRAKLEKIIEKMPRFIQPLIHRLPLELYDEVRHPRPTQPTEPGMGMKDGNLYICIDGSVYSL
uniref:uncharacterized protein LOC122609135 n=1 Tax=Erigeron canadensis TaxID=72917 RepID=UPI001CB9D3D6|nr:uncharacterized protein LOC122609135 [Erigeron canadensis]